MQVDPGRRGPFRRPFQVERPRFSVKRTNFKDAFAVTHHNHVITYDVLQIPHRGAEHANRPIGFEDTFFSAKTIDQLIAEQGIRPVADVGIFAGVIPDEDIDEFVADIYRDRIA
jgi:hypothetical protein